MALHEQCVGATDEWYTPPHVFDALGCRFDLDVASPGMNITPWIPADGFVTDRSLERNWSGFLWMNAPFGARNGLVPWLEKFFVHGNGIALTPDRTSAPWWQRFSGRAHKVLFISPKLKFIGVNGLPGDSPAQGTTLMAIGSRGAAALHRAADNGLGVLMAPQITGDVGKRARERQMSARRMKCSDTGKSIYWTIVEVERAAADFGMRAYSCPSCKRWHLSSIKQPVVGDASKP